MTDYGDKIIYRKPQKSKDGKKGRWWCIQGKNLEPGQVVTVTRKDGTTETETVKEVLERDEQGNCLATFVQKPPKPKPSPVTDPRLIPFYNTWMGTYSAVQAAEEALAEAESCQNEAEQDLLEQVRQALGLPTTVKLVRHCGWECPTSPIGECLYNDRDQYNWEYCIFCHEPFERK